MIAAVSVIFIFGILLSWGTGTIFASLAFSLLLSILAVEMQKPAIAVAIALLLFSGPLIARISYSFIQNLSVQKLPQSLFALLVVSGFLFAVDEPGVYSTIAMLLSPSQAISTTGIITFCGAIITAAAIFAALALIFVALVELPFYWVFSGKHARSIRWLPGMRPILLVLFIGLSIEQIGSYLTNLVDQSSVAIVVDGGDKQ